MLPHNSRPLVIAVAACLCVNVVFFHFSRDTDDGEPSWHKPLTPVIYSQVSPSYSSISLVTFTTLDRLYALVTMADQWAPQPIVVAVYVPFPTPANFTNDYLQWACWDEPAKKNWERELLKVHKARKRYESLAKYVEFHFIVQGLNYFGLPAALFPYNDLRNVALSHVKTEFLFIADIDLFPASDFAFYVGHETLQELRMSKQALVVPTFSRWVYDLTPEIPEIIDPRISELDPAEISALVQDQFPKTKKELLEQLVDGTLWPTTLLSTQSATQYNVWVQCNDEYEIDFYAAYEPYVILSTDIAPRFNENIKGYKGDKQAYLAELGVRGFQFVVLPDVFVIHIKHSQPVRRNFGTEVYKPMRKFFVEASGCPQFGKAYPVHSNITTEELNLFIRRFKYFRVEKMEVPENCTLMVPREPVPPACKYLEWKQPFDVPKPNAMTPTKPPEEEWFEPEKTQDEVKEDEVVLKPPPPEVREREKTNRAEAIAKERAKKEHERATTRKERHGKVVVKTRHTIRIKHKPDAPPPSTSASSVPTPP